MKFRLFGFLLVFAIIGCKSRKDKIEELINEVTQGTDFNGFIHLNYRGDTLYDGALSTIDATIPIPQRNSRIYLASLSKLFTELTILKLADLGQIHLDSSIASYRSSFKPSFGQKITVRQLLKMSSGLPRELDVENLFSSLMLNNQGLAGPFLDSIPNFDLEYEPGTSESYSNLNYWLLGSVIEAVTSKNLNDALRQYLLNPLNMNQSGFIPSGAKPLQGYKFEKENWVMHQSDLKMRYASGGYYSSVNDLLALSKAVRSGGFVSDEMRSNLFQANDSRLEVYGSLPTYTNMFIFDPKANLTLIVLNNIGLTDLNTMTMLKTSIDKILNLESDQSRSPKRVQLNSIDRLNDSVALEAHLKIWIEAIESGDEDRIYSVFNEISVANEDRNDPTWAEIVRVHSELPNFKAKGFRWVKEEPVGLEVWFASDTVGKIAFRWIPDEANPDKVGMLFVAPDDMEWLGKSY